MIGIMVMTISIYLLLQWCINSNKLLYFQFCCCCNYITGVQVIQSVPETGTVDNGIGHFAALRYFAWKFCGMFKLS